MHAPPVDNQRRAFVVGTAGHVDHGKSTLVRKLTGIDPDRFQEEKDRELTIDLGFAWLDLPGGASVSIIDVPGHERFIKNMLAGVGGLDAAMLVVAADEGPMPQTIEHLAILDLLSISTGVVVLSKADLVDKEWLDLIVEETRETLVGTALADAPILPVSATTGLGIDDLVATLESLLNALPERVMAGRPRLPVDRVFSVTGFGTVVTGTLLGRPVEIGQELEILPSMTRARVRGLQSHGEKVDVALPGARTAINLTGVDRESIQRGDVITTPGWLKSTRMLDAWLRLMPAAPHPLVQNDPVDVFTGATERQAHVTLLDSDEIAPGSEGWVQIRFDRPLAVSDGDLFIIRQASPSLTIGGGRVLNAHPRRHRRFRDEVIRELETRASGAADERVLQVLSDGPAELRTLSSATGLTSDAVSDIVAELLETGEVLVLGYDRGTDLAPNRVVATVDSMRTMRDLLTGLLSGFHERYPLRRGMAREEVRRRTGLPARHFDALVQTLVAEGVIGEDASTLALADHQVKLDARQQELADRFVRALQGNRVAPPAPSEFNIDTELLTALAGQGRVVRVSDNIVYSAEQLAAIQKETLAIIEEQGEITLAQFRDHFGSSRKYAQAVLEYFDQQRVTRRVGDVRVRGSA